MSPQDDMTSKKQQDFLAELMKAQYVYRCGFQCFFFFLTCSIQRQESMFGFRYYISGCWKTGVCPEEHAQDGKMAEYFVVGGLGKDICIIELENKNGTIITVFKYLEGQYMDEGFILFGVAPEAKLRPMKQSSSQSKQLNIDISLPMGRASQNQAVSGSMSSLSLKIFRDQTTNDLLEMQQALQYQGEAVEQSCFNIFQLLHNDCLLIEICILHCTYT